MYGLLGQDNIWLRLFENLESEGAKKNKKKIYIYIYWENHL